MMGDKQKEDEHINEVLRDWKLLAQKADYFLFWVFFTITTVTRSVELRAAAAAEAGAGRAHTYYDVRKIFQVLAFGN